MPTHRAGASGAQASHLPKWIKPQLTRLAEEAPTGNDWLHEIKYDGYRMHARLDGGRIQLLTGPAWTGRIGIAPPWRGRLGRAAPRVRLSLATGFLKSVDDRSHASAFGEMLAALLNHIA